MSKLLLFDFECPCGAIFEDLVSSDTIKVICKCGKEAFRVISPVRSDWKNMGVSNDFPSAAARWERAQRKRAKSDKSDGPNLWMY